MTTTVGHLGRDQLVPNSVDVSRTGVLGNPFRRSEAGALGALALFNVWFDRQIVENAAYRALVENVRGKVLLCHCKPRAGFQGKFRCHAQKIAAWLNGCTPEDVP